MRRRGGRGGGGVFSFLFRLAIIAAVLFGGYVVVERSGGVNNLIDRVSSGIAVGVNEVDGRIMGEGGGNGQPNISDERKALLDELPVNPGDPAGFTRAAFLPAGYGTSDPDGTCTILRQSILVDQGTGDDCANPSGPWIDHFTNQEITNLDDVMVSAVVPWDKLWAGGGNVASSERRSEMASDPENIVLSTESLDRNGRTIDSWVPEHDVCGYADGYAKILSKYNLSITEPEREALLDIWGRC